MNVPYTYKAVGQGIGQAAQKYEIYFKNEKIREIYNLMERDVKDWVFLLNSAFLNGQNKIY